MFQAPENQDRRGSGDRIGEVSYALEIPLARSGPLIGGASCQIAPGSRSRRPRSRSSGPARFLRRRAGVAGPLGIARVAVDVDIELVVGRVGLDEVLRRRAAPQVQIVRYRARLAAADERIRGRREITRPARPAVTPVLPQVVGE